MLPKYRESRRPPRNGANGRFGAKHLAHRFARIEVGAADQVNAVRHGRKNAGHHLLALRVLEALQCFGNGFGLTRQVDDQALVAHHGHLA